MTIFIQERKKNHNHVHLPLYILLFHHLSEIFESYNDPTYFY